MTSTSNDEINEGVNLENIEDDSQKNDLESPYSSESINVGVDAKENNSSANEDNKDTKISKSRRVLNFIKWFLNRYLIVALTGMSQGLFVTLIAGCVIKQFGKLFGQNTSGGSMFIAAGNIASLLMGPGIGAGIAKSLDSSNLVIFATIVAGIIGAFSDKFIDKNWIIDGKISVSPGNPIGAYINSVIACEIGNLVVKLKTRLDILLVPLFIIIASIGGSYVCWPFRTAGTYIADGIGLAMNEQPALMSIVLSAWVGLLLTLPTSSAATCISLNIRGLAGGAAVTGCCSHMVGFAVASFRENGWRGFISQGIGTSMLQIPNLVKHPLIIVPEVITSIIVAPIATLVFKLECDASASGMGTAGLVGIFGIIEGSSGVLPAWKIGVGIFVTQFLLPALLNLAISEFMRWRGWIKYGDQKLEP
ncbi:putative toxin regulator PfoR [Tritrichomonas foetus]|uniref:Toxin regulator PfoR n=1 Tax=Tritrichomonas foetus TaxID=1144522 RepID=A0A1J4KL79_9EUKA|nr:putative toxin regulator PfoR [Tritrichomonas foetus]|eukprot:OHT10454.1 putative toxin regulator PfoR [Tritrichomonas foetus]